MNVMFHSKRKLLSTYKEYKNILYDFAGCNNLTLKEETRNEAYKIVENEHGTHIYQPGIHNILPALDIALNELDYLFLDGTYLDFEKYLAAVEIYKEALFDMRDDLPSFTKEPKAAFSFRTAESFLNSLSKKSTQTEDVDLSKYEAGVRVFHKKFGEGTINYIEEEGQDYKRAYCPP